MLEACDFRELIEIKQRDYFEGSREWLLDEIQTWILSPHQRLCWLVGGAGTGKSVVSAQLLAKEGLREYIKAWHFCRHDNAAESDVRVILQSWAAMLTAGVNGFEVADVGKALGSATASELFNMLIARPLKNLARDSTEKKTADTPCKMDKPCVIVFDALDELPRDSVNEVLQLLAEEFDKLPPFIRLFVAVNRCLLSISTIFRVVMKPQSAAD